QVFALLPPQRPFGRALSPAETVGQMLDRLRGRDDLFQFRGELLDLRRRPGSLIGPGTAHLSRTSWLRLMSTTVGVPALSPPPLKVLPRPSSFTKYTADGRGVERGWGHTVMISQQHIALDTPMGASLLYDGATFR